MGQWRGRAADGQPVGLRFPWGSGVIGFPALCLSLESCALPGEQAAVFCAYVHYMNHPLADFLPAFTLHSAILPEEDFPSGSVLPVHPAGMERFG